MVATAEFEAMNTFTASLCSKPAIGVAMWLASLCASNQALHEKFANLTSTGVVLSADISAPMSETYRLILILPSKDGERGMWKPFLCPPDTAQKSVPNHGTKLVSEKIRLQLLSTTDVSIADEVFALDCATPRSFETDAYTVGALHIEKGKYHVILTNQTNLVIPGSDSVRVLLVGDRHA